MMSNMVSGEVIQQLEQRHVELIEELDALNNRLEEALNSFVKQGNDARDREKRPNVECRMSNVE